MNFHHSPTLPPHDHVKTIGKPEYCDKGDLYPTKTIEISEPGNLDFFIHFAEQLLGNRFSWKRLTSDDNLATRGFEVDTKSSFSLILNSDVLLNDLVIIWRKMKNLDEKHYNIENTIEMVPIGHMGIWHLEAGVSARIFEIDRQFKCNVSEAIGHDDYSFPTFERPIFDADLLDLFDRWREVGYGTAQSCDRLNGKYFETIIVSSLLKKYSASGLRKVECIVFENDTKQSIIEYIDKNISKKISVLEIANHVGIEEIKFRRSFRYIFGVTPCQFVIQRRVERALYMLKTSQIPIAQIALDMGFSSQAHFSMVFSRYVGVAPGRYRRGATL